MLKFAALSLAQKRFVVAVLEAHPQYKKKPEITLKECASIYYVMRDQADSNRAMKALAWRVGLSMGLFLLLLVSYWFGWIQGRPA